MRTFRLPAGKRGGYAGNLTHCHLLQEECPGGVWQPTRPNGFKAAASFACASIWPGLSHN